jgi:plastocyanin
MLLSVSRRLAFSVTCAALLWSCGGDWTRSSPSSPSSLSSETSRNTPGRASTVELRRVDNDGDGYDDGPENTPAPAPEMPAPEMPAPGAPAPNPDQAPAPVLLTVNIVGAFGTGAFVPNPLQAAVGNTIVWTNSDLIPHIIVLDDGTPVGDLAPGQSSLPISLATETMGYHCTLHPTMVGQVTTLVPGAPVPPGGSQNPPPDPSAPAPPSPDPYGGGYEDGYEDDYYLAPVR